MARDVVDELSILVVGPGERYSVPVRKDLLTVGRFEGADIYLPDVLVSRKHAVLRFNEGLVTVEDLTSVNGTRLRDLLIRPHRPTRVGRGDVIVIGASVLVIQQPKRVALRLVRTSEIVAVA